MTNAYREIATRIVNAEESFVGYVTTAIGCTSDEANRVLGYYRKHKLVKVDAVSGTWAVKHGGFLDVDVLRNAVREVNS